MKIKRFQAETLYDALKKARQTLGADAAIFSSYTSASDGVELLAYNKIPDGQFINQNSGKYGVYQ